MNADRLQKFEWGTIEWIYEPGNNPYTVMNIGTIRIFPKMRQNKHVHYSDEQLLYVLSGSGKQIINNQVARLQPGMIFHMDPGDMHETINDGNEDLVELLISIPVNFENGKMTGRNHQTHSENRLGDDFNLKMIADVIADFYKSMLKPLNVPLFVFDADGSVILQSDEIPAFCDSVCQIGRDIGNCELYSIRDEYKPPYYYDHTSYVCRYGITVLYLPITHQDRMVGWIRGGHVRETDRIIDVTTEFELPYERSKSSMNSLLRLMINFQRKIQDYLALIQTDQQLIEKDNQLQEQVEKKIRLENSLRKTQSKMLNIQINNHFLFNTLSAIAGLAIQDGSAKTYDAIIHLSKMFRYSMNDGQKGVSLLEEIKHIEDYLNLQKIRFEDRLDFDISIQCEELKWDVPFNFLQPIVENAFKHGFKNRAEGMRVDVSCRQRLGNLRISVKDNGCGMSAEKQKNLLRDLKEKKGRLSGLVMIMMKLERLYGDRVSIEIDSRAGMGTEVAITIPKE